MTLKKSSFFKLLFILFVVSSFGFTNFSKIIKSTKVTKRSLIDNKKTVESAKEFYKNGNLKTQSEYDYDGKLETETIFFYNENRLTKKVEKNIDFKSTEVTLITFETKTNIRKTKVTDDNKLRYILEETLNKNDSVVKLKQIVGANEVNVTYNYVRDASHRIVLKERMLDGEKSTAKTFIYDTYNNLIEVLTHDEYVIRKTKHEHNNGKLLGTIKSIITRDGNERLEREYVFDEFMNPIHTKIYNEGKLITEHKMTYTFDKHQNWTEKTVNTKDYIWKNNDGFIPNYIETRKIKYW